MKNKCPSWRGKATVRPRRQGRLCLAFTGAKRKPLTEEADGAGAGFSQEGQLRELCLGVLDEISENEFVCNRYRLTHSKQYLSERFQALDESGPEDHPRYNIAPTQQVLVVRKEKGEKVRHLTTMRWGLIPSWAKDMSIGNKTLNARSETVTTTPAFRESIVKKRCLIPADGFYEWRKMGSVKQPYCFEVGDGEVFALAGLWDEWTSPDGEVIESCTILTTGPNSLVEELHDRMPVIVPQEKYDLWLDPDVTDFAGIRDLLRPYEATLMRRHPVSTKLNNAKHDDAESAAPITLKTAKQDSLF
jgi:putative SOS response-associated peptidase YedK